MTFVVIPMSSRKRIALIAHDNCKDDMLDWARYNRGTLAHHELYATGTTGARLTGELHVPVTPFLSGPLGGDQQVGAAIAEGRLLFVIFFWDPLEPHPHDVDVKALLRIAVVYNRTKRFAVKVLDFVDTLPTSIGGQALARQVARSGLGVAGNYRGACRGRSHTEFTARLGVVLEESDESELWLEVAEEKSWGGTNAKKLAPQREP